MAFGKALMETRILASGSTQKLKVMECTSSPTATNMKVSGTRVLERATALTSSQMEIATLDSITRANLKASVNISGRMAAVTLDNL